MPLCAPNAIALVRFVGSSTLLCVAVGFALAAVPVAAQAADEPNVSYETDIVYGQGAGEDLKLDLAWPTGLDHPARLYS